MMIAEGFTCQRYGFNVGADKFSLLTIENGKTSIMRLSEWTLISQSQKSHSDRLLGAVIVMSIEPTMEFNDKSGMATSSRKKAIDLWQTQIPAGNREELAKLLFCVDNPLGTKTDQRFAGSVEPAASRPQQTKL